MTCFVMVRHAAIGTDGRPCARIRAMASRTAGWSRDESSSPNSSLGLPDPTGGSAARGRGPDAGGNGTSGFECLGGDVAGTSAARDGADGDAAAERVEDAAFRGGGGDAVGTDWTRASARPAARAGSDGAGQAARASSA
jgi:hypothetical protein